MTRVSSDRAVWLANHILPHEPALRAWLRQRKVLNLEIDDIVQETYAVLAGLESIEHIHSPRSYMFSIAHSIILRHLRHARVVAIEAMAEIEQLGILSEEPSPERLAADTQELRRIAALIEALPAKCREAFTLRKVEGLSQREVAARMGISENTVEKHVGKAIRVLMDALERDADRKEESTPASRRSYDKARDER